MTASDANSVNDFAHMQSGACRSASGGGERRSAGRLPRSCWKTASSRVRETAPSPLAIPARMRKSSRCARRHARLGNYRLNGATLYVTVEPCVMCAGAIDSGANRASCLRLRRPQGRRRTYLLRDIRSSRAQSPRRGSWRRFGSRNAPPRCRRSLPRGDRVSRLASLRLLNCRRVR